MGDPARTALIAGAQAPSADLRNNRDVFDRGGDLSAITPRAVVFVWPLFGFFDGPVCARFVEAFILTADTNG